MKKRTKSLLEEINAISPHKDMASLLESRGSNALNAIINLVEMIEENYDEEVSNDLIKRVMLSIKNRDTDRFQRGIRKLRESK